ncbi:hypothetical protein MLD52_09750 [Puniceicoccaceae bacterium K14]|nr:hypothetical protein [Puniceicoccaceae bacterium K14]
MGFDFPFNKPDLSTFDTSMASKRRCLNKLIDGPMSLVAASTMTRALLIDTSYVQLFLEELWVVIVSAYGHSSVNVLGGNFGEVIEANE